MERGHLPVCSRLPGPTPGSEPNHCRLRPDETSSGPSLSCPLDSDATLVSSTALHLFPGDGISPPETCCAYSESSAAHRSRPSDHSATSNRISPAHYCFKSTTAFSPRDYSANP